MSAVAPDGAPVTVEYEESGRMYYTAMHIYYKQYGDFNLWI